MSNVSYLVENVNAPILGLFSFRYSTCLSDVSGFGAPSYRRIMVDLRINETLQTSAVA